MGSITSAHRYRLPRPLDRQLAHILWVVKEHSPTALFFLLCRTCQDLDFLAFSMRLYCLLFTIYA